MQKVVAAEGAGHCGEQASAQPHSHHRATRLETCLEHFVLCLKIVEQHVQIFSAKSLSGCVPSFVVRYAVISERKLNKKVCSIYRTLVEESRSIQALRTDLFERDNSYVLQDQLKHIPK